MLGSVVRSAVVGTGVRLPLGRDLDDGNQLTAGEGAYETASIVKVDILVSLLVQRNGSLATAQNGWLQRSTTELWDVTSIGCVEAHGHRFLVVVLVTSASSMSRGVSTIEKAASTAVTRVLAA
jgi:hypothetical protein